MISTIVPVSRGSGWASNLPKLTQLAETESIFEPRPLPKDQTHIYPNDILLLSQHTAQDKGLSLGYGREVRGTDMTIPIFRRGRTLKGWGVGQSHEAGEH